MSGKLLIPLLFLPVVYLDYFFLFNSAALSVQMWCVFVGNFMHGSETSAFVQQPDLRIDAEPRESVVVWQLPLSKLFF